MSEPYDPYAVVREHPDWTVDWQCAELPDDTHGMWMHRCRVLFLRKGLTRVERRCAVAHEVEHALAGHRGDVPVNIQQRQEAWADQEASRKLIPIELFAQALQWSNDWSEVADYCDVTPRLLKVRRDHLHPAEEHYLQRVLDAKGEPA